MKIQRHVFLEHAGGSTPSEQEAATTEITRASTAKTVYLWSRNYVATVLCETSSSSAHEVQHPRSKLPRLLRSSGSRLRQLFILDPAVDIAIIPFVSVHPSNSDRYPPFLPRSVLPAAGFVALPCQSGAFETIRFSWRQLASDDGGKSG